MGVDISDVTEELLNFEKHTSLLNGLHAREWAHYRIKAYYRILSDLNVINDVSLDYKSKGLLFKIKYMMKCVTKINFRYLLFNKKKYLIFSHPRSQGTRDIYSNELMEALGGSETVLNISHSEKLQFQGVRDSFTDLFRVSAKLSAIVLRVFFYRKSSEQLSCIDDLVKSKLFKSLDIDNYKKDYFLNIYEYKILYRIYKIFLKFNSFDEIFIVTAYYNLPLVHAAKDLGIKTTELQHGVISRQHIAYNVKDSSCVPFCERVAFWGSYWSNVGRIPVGVEKIILGNGLVVANSEPNEINRRTISNERKKVIVISQVSISTLMLDFVVSNMHDLADIDIYYKLHPGEYSSSKIVTDRLLNSFGERNIKVITNEYTLEELLDICHIQIGAYSTGIFQGLNKGLKTIVIPSPGIAYLDSLIEMNLIKICQNKNDIISALSSNTVGSTERTNIFFKPFNNSMLS